MRRRLRKVWWSLRRKKRLRRRQLADRRRWKSKIKRKGIIEIRVRDVWRRLRRR